MKRILTIIVIAIAISATITSCTASRGTFSHGCKSTQGMIGYGR